MKELDSVKEPAERRAAIKWRNNQVRQQILAERKKPKRGDPTDEEQKAEIGKVIANEGRLGTKVKRFESKSKRDIREMMERQTAINMALYIEFLERRKIKLLREKLKRLKAKQAEAEEAEKKVKKDLFGFPV